MNIQFPSPRPRSPRRPLRSGVTLTEVLISMAILAIGLFGAAAMFPVGGYFMQKGEIADRGAAIAQAAFADLVARGDLHPSHWQAWDGSSGNYAAMDGLMRGSMVAAASGDPSIADFQRDLNAAVGFIYIIDPLGTAAGFRQLAGTNGIRQQLLFAPYAWQTSLPSMSIAEQDRWRPFVVDQNGDPTWPVRRLCTPSVIVNDQVASESLAQQIYSSGDDITFSVDDEDVPTRQRVISADTNSDGNLEAVARESNGDYSWMAMVAPTTSNARQALALDPSAYYYDVSVIVFFKRPISNIDTTEALVNGNIISTGTGGGEMLLDSAGITDAFEELRAGQWVMVSGPHPNSTELEPLFFTQWYRVLAIDDEQRGPIADAERQRLIGLRGPDWPWNAGASLRVGLFPGAVAVHTKTMRLETIGAY